MANLPSHRLAASNPAQVNNSLASLAQSLGVDLQVRKDHKSEYDQHGAFLGYKPTGRIAVTVGGNLGAIAALMDRIEGAFAPASVEQVEMWLAELDQIAPRRAASSADDDLRLRAYTERLMGFPADVAREALLGRIWRFWPSWAELHEACTELTAQRRAVQSELARQVEAIREREARARSLPHPEGATLTESEREAQRANRSRTLGALIAEMTAKTAAQDAERVASQEAAAERYRQSKLTTAAKMDTGTTTTINGDPENSPAGG